MDGHRPRFVIIPWYVTCALCYMWRMTLWRCDNFRSYVHSFFSCSAGFFPISLAAICYCCRWTRTDFLFLLSCRSLFVTIVRKKNVNRRNTNNEKWHKRTAYKHKRAKFMWPHSFSLSLFSSCSFYLSLDRFFPYRLVYSLLNWFYWRVQFKFYFEITHQAKPFFFFGISGWPSISCSWAFYALVVGQARVDDRTHTIACSRIL